MILLWADDHYCRFGEWPTADSGRVRLALNENWSALNVALRAGVRTLPGGGSLARLLAQHRNVRNRKALPKLSVTQILEWADDYRARTGRWPTAASGTIPDATPGETWMKVQLAISHGCRGFSPGSSLAWILAEHRNVGDYYTRKTLTEADILRWADEQYRRTGRWPSATHEVIASSPSDTWKNMDGLLRRGGRGLKGGSSLARLLADRRRHRNVADLPKLTDRRILAWADAHHRATGAWPTENSGPVVGADGETWAGVDAALRAGGRGLIPGRSLARLLDASKRKRNRRAQPALSEPIILRWADAHRRKNGGVADGEERDATLRPGRAVELDR